MAERTLMGVYRQTDDGIGEGLEDSIYILMDDLLCTYGSSEELKLDGFSLSTGKEGLSQ